MEESVEKVATRNMFYDESGKHVRTKKEILNEDGKIREGCKVIPKGEVYERNLFTTKNKQFKQEKFLDDVKHSFTELINLYVKDDKDRLKVFDKNGVYLPMKKIGKNNPKEEQIKADNQVRENWNQTVDHALVCGVPEKDILELKACEINAKVKGSVEKNGTQPGLWTAIVKLATAILQRIISRIFKEQTDKEKENVTVADVKHVIPAEVKVPPKMTILASKYIRLEEAYEKLQKQNRAINCVEKERDQLLEELAELKGVFKGKKRQSLQDQIDNKNHQIKNMKEYLANIVKPYHYENVNEFMKEFKASMTEYEAYLVSLKNWNGGDGLKKDSLLRRLEQEKQAVKDVKREK